METDDTFEKVAQWGLVVFGLFLGVCFAFVAGAMALDFVMDIVKRHFG